MRGCDRVDIPNWVRGCCPIHCCRSWNWMVPRRSFEESQDVPKLKTDWLVVVFITTLFCLWNYYDRSIGFHGEPYAFSHDFWIYREAGGGNFVLGWLYKDWLGITFWPLTILDYQTSWIAWYGLQSACVIFLSLKMYKEFGLYGLVGNLVIYKTSSWALASGNIAPVLAVLCLSPAGALVATLYKPYCIVFAFIHALRARGRHNQDAWFFLRRDS